MLSDYAIFLIEAAANLNRTEEERKVAVKKLQNLSSEELLTESAYSSWKDAVDHPTEIDLKDAVADGWKDAVACNRYENAVVLSTRQIYSKEMALQLIQDSNGQPFQPFPGSVRYIELPQIDAMVTAVREACNKKRQERIAAAAILESAAQATKPVEPQAATTREASFTVSTGEGEVVAYATLLATAAAEYNKKKLAHPFWKQEAPPDKERASLLQTQRKWC